MAKWESPFKPPANECCTSGKRLNPWAVKNVCNGIFARNSLWPVKISWIVRISKLVHNDYVLLLSRNSDWCDRCGLRVCHWVSLLLRTAY
jgi:hypothetical protein